MAHPDKVYACPNSDECPFVTNCLSNLNRHVNKECDYKDEGKPKPKPS